MPPPQGSWNPIEGPGDYTVTSTIHNNSYPAISPLATATHTGKRVFIAGASRGIGLAIALSFAQAGASFIALGARSDLSSVKQDVSKAAQKAGHPEPKVICVSVEITSESSVSSSASEIKKEFGGLDILVLNAGIIGTPKKVAESEVGKWWDVLEVNLKGPYLLSRAFIPLLLATDGGSGMKTIVTTSSVGAHVVRSGLSAYQTSKLAVLRLAQFVSEDYKDEGIVNIVIHPGNVLTDMTTGLGEMPEALKAVFTETPDLPADTITYLTRIRRPWLAGRYVNCTWDMPELMAKEEAIVKGDKLKVKLDVDF